MRTVVAEILQDWGLNQGRRKSQVILVLFRLASLTHRGRTLSGPIGRVYIGSYKVLTNWFMGVELPPEAEIGPRLRLFHPHAIVVHPDTRIGAHCTLRQCVTLGNVDRADGPSGAPTPSPEACDPAERCRHLRWSTMELFWSRPWKSR